MKTRQSVLIALVAVATLFVTLGCTRVFEPPIAAFSISGLNGSVCIIGSELSFDGSETCCPSGESIVQYEWDFGDGQRSHGPEARHSFTANQTYTVQLRVTDSRGGTDTVTRTVTVVGNPCPANPDDALDPIIKLELTSLKFGMCTIEYEAGQELPMEKCDTIVIRVLARDPDNRDQDNSIGITYCSATIVSPSGKTFRFSTNPDEGTPLELSNPMFDFSLTELGTWTLSVEVRDDERISCQGHTYFVQTFQATLCAECTAI